MLKLSFVSLGKNFDASVRLVSHPAFYAMVTGVALCVVAKANALHVAMHPNVYGFHSIICLRMNEISLNMYLSSKNRVTKHS